VEVVIVKIVFDYTFVDSDENAVVVDNDDFVLVVLVTVDVLGAIEEVW